MENENNSSKLFNIKKSELQFAFKFFTLNYIKTELEKIGNLSIREVQVDPPCKPRNSNRFVELRSRNNTNRYFTYIKSFEKDGEKYGIVGGKTNYFKPDIDYDCLNENEK